MNVDSSLNHLVFEELDEKSLGS